MAQAIQGDYGRPGRWMRITISSMRIMKILTDVSPVGDWAVEVRRGPRTPILLAVHLHHTTAKTPLWGSSIGGNKSLGEAQTLSDHRVKGETGYPEVPTRVAVPVPCIDGQIFGGGTARMKGEGHDQRPLGTNNAYLEPLTRIRVTASATQVG